MGDLGDEIREVSIHIGVRKFSCRVQGLVDERHAPGPALEILFQCTASLGILVSPVQAEQKDKCGQVIIDPVRDLGKQNLSPPASR